MLPKETAFWSWARGGKLKRLRKTPGEIARSRAKIVQALQTADALAKLPAPRTCKQWVRLFHHVVSIVRHAGKSQVVGCQGMLAAGHT